MIHKSRNTIRVLLVDDDPIVLRSLTRVMHEFDLNVETAMCAAEARAILKHHDFDVVVSDHQMPGQTGLEFLADLKASKPDQIVMMLSGHICGVNVAEDWAKEIGVQAVFSKPFDADQISAEIVSLLVESD